MLIDLCLASYRGCLWKPTQSKMAATTAPTCFSRDETIFACTESAASSSERFFRRGFLNQRGVLELKLWSGNRHSRTFQLATSHRNFFQMVSRAFPSTLGQRDRTSLAVRIDTAACFSEVEKDINSPSMMLLNTVNKWRKVLVIAAASVLTCIFLVVPSAEAVDSLKTCACLLKECRVELAKCIADPSCAANVACLQTCNNRPDETECQIKCGDLFENSVVDQFNECAVSRNKCVPRKSDVGDFPIPDPASLVKSFNIGNFSGKWYITSGLNPTFDAFDCQLHEFHMEANKLVGNLSWRIRTPDSGFFTRSAVQKFVQDPSQPGILYNHDNEYLHYQDDWYILSSKIENRPDDYVFVYYRGRNDAWDGYGGAVVYTRSAVLPDSIIPELEKAAKSVGRDFNKFIRTDNTCGPEPPLVERLEKTVEETVEEGEETIVREVEEIEGEVEKVGKTGLTLFQRLTEGFKELQQDEENFLRELSKEEMEILGGLKMEASEVEKLFQRAIPLRKLR